DTNGQSYCYVDLVALMALPAFLDIAQLPACPLVSPGVQNGPRSTARSPCFIPVISCIVKRASMVVSDLSVATTDQAWLDTAKH
ncbi:MAG: hypothetical protein ACKN9M_04375, partial [Burkholderiaceae bacterium]